MAVQTITPGSWQSVTTTTTDTLFQNKTPREVYLCVGSTAGVDFKDGFLMAPFQGIILKAGLVVSACSFVGDATLFTMEV